MESLKTESLPPPPGVVGSLKAGFDAVAAHLPAILLPLALDVFLWLGPRLSVEQLFMAVLPQAAQTWRALGLSAEQVDQVVQQNLEILPRINLFWLFRTLPIGISSVFFGRPVSASPLGTSAVISVDGETGFFGWLFLLTLAGWVGGGLYFRSVARLIEVKGQGTPVGAGHAVLQSIVLSLACLVVMIVLGLPVFIILALLVQSGSFIAQVSLVVFSFASMWILVPLFFWPHGIFIYKQSALLSIFNSLRLARYTLPTSSVFVLTLFLLTVGLNFLWGIPPEDSWMTLVGIFAHAFIATALLASSFIYYRDVNWWLQAVLVRMKSNSVMRT